MTGSRSIEPRALSPPRRRVSRLQRQEHRAALGFVLPSFVLFFVFDGLAVLVSFGLSFTKWNLFNAVHFAGISNYVFLFHDPVFHKVLINTVLFVVGTVPIQMVLSLAVALLLNREIPGRPVFRLMYFLPVVSQPVAVALVWSWLFNTNYGLINSVISALGVSHPPGWLNSTQWALPAVMVVAIWQQVGYSMVLFLAGLQSIPQELYDAGELDGAVGWDRLRYLTLPMLSPTTFFILIISVIFSFQVFDLTFVMTNGGPANATNTIVFDIYQNAFVFYRMGVATAIAWVLFFIIFVFTLIQYRLQRLWVFYE
ncbi:MAG TPA: sugar ABC transporter permease [Spirochaetia bacterium]|nr:sugar ABC transporter permease [Spirochaetia bacterium]